MSSPLRLLDRLVGVVVAGAAFALVVKLARPSPLDDIPTAGSTSWLGSWWAGAKYLFNAVDVIQEGYEKYKPAAFKVAELSRWTVMLSSREHIEEISSSSDDVLSPLEAINDLMNVEYLMKPQLHHNPYHIHIVRSQLTRNIETLYPDIIDEIRIAFDDVLDLTGGEWKSVPALSSIRKVVCRTSNRVFVGLPLCRDPDWIDLNIRYTVDVIKGAILIRMFPGLLKPMAVRFLTNVNESNQRGRKLLGPIIEERLESLNEYGNEWTDRPNDFLSWCMEEAEGPELMVELLTARMLLVNLLSIHTASNSFTQVLFYLASNPEYIRPLREEVESIVGKYGWSKASLSRMRKIDSFIKECQRFEGLSSVSLARKTMKDFTFSDGTFIPKGVIVLAAARCIQYDETFYEDARVFKPFRFSDLRQEDGEDEKHQLVSTSTEFLPFGHGRHACAGRFFAANEMKSMLAHVVVTFDVKLPDNVTRPRTLRLATELVPDPSAEIMFRRVN